MIRVVNGKRYNTETAERVACASNGAYYSDFNYWSEDLYLTKKGSWFLHGEGGGLTSYAKILPDGSRTGGESIRPMTRAAARAWLEENDETDALDEKFGEEIEDA